MRAWLNGKEISIEEITPEQIKDIRLLTIHDENDANQHFNAETQKSLDDAYAGLIDFCAESQRQINRSVVRFFLCSLPIIFILFVTLYWILSQ